MEPQTQTAVSGPVSIRLGQGKSKRLSIDYSGSKPTFLFHGVWSGRDAKVIRNLLWREYLRYSQEIRREAIKEGALQ